MKRPEALETLLIELTTEFVFSDVTTSTKSEALIYPDSETTDEQAIRLNSTECRVVFANIPSVKRLLEALDFPEEANLVLTDIRTSDRVQDYLERKFCSVDEG